MGKHADGVHDALDRIKIIQSKLEVLGGSFGVVGNSKLCSSLTLIKQDIQQHMIVIIKKRD